MLLTSAVIAPSNSFDDEPLRLDSPFGQETAAVAVQTANDNPRTVEEELQSRFAGAQRELANVAMYLSPDFRSRITKQLRILLSVDNWDQGDNHLTQESAKSFARAMALLRPLKRPILGLSNAGNLLAMWKEEGAQVTFEHLPNDHVRWSVSSGTGTTRDQAAGRTPVERVQGIVRGHSLTSLLYG